MTMFEGNPVSILLIDDDEDDYVLTREILEEIENFNHRLDWEKNFEQARKLILERNHEIYLIDYRLGERDGLTLIAEAVQEGVQNPMILLTGKGDKRIDMQAMRQGAWDYLVKSEITADMLERTIRYSLNNSRALRRVRNEEQKFRQLFERSVDAIFLSDFCLQLEDVNSSFCKLLECTHQSLLGESLYTLFRQQEAVGVFKQMLADSGEIRDFETSLNSRNGKELICQISITGRYDEDGKHIGYQGFLHDVTLKKKAERELLLAERLSLTGKLARSIGHEIRNPLTNLNLAMDQLEDELPDNEDVDLYVDIIRRNSGRIEQLISELLNSSRPRDLNKIGVSVGDLLENSLALVRDRITLKGMQLTTRFESPDRSVTVDPEKMKIALVNILVNAIEAMEEGMGILEVGVALEGDLVLMTISDNGCGISQEDLILLFDPFYTKKRGGMGLGLTSTQNIIHSHGGHIRVESIVGHGTTFYIHLPLTD